MALEEQFSALCAPPLQLFEVGVRYVDNRRWVPGGDAKIARLLSRHHNPLGEIEPGQAASVICGNSRNERDITPDFRSAAIWIEHNAGRLNPDFSYPQRSSV